MFIRVLSKDFAQMSMPQFLGVYRSLMANERRRVAQKRHNRPNRREIFTPNNRGVILKIRKQTSATPARISRMNDLSIHGKSFISYSSLPSLRRGLIRFRRKATAGVINDTALKSSNASLTRASDSGRMTLPRGGQATPRSPIVKNIFSDPIILFFIEMLVMLHIIIFLCDEITEHIHEA